MNVYLGGNTIMFDGIVGTITYIKEDGILYAVGHSMSKNYIGCDVHLCEVKRVFWRLNGVETKRIGVVIDQNKYGLVCKMQDLEPIAKVKMGEIYDVRLGSASLRFNIGDGIQSCSCSIYKITKKEILFTITNTFFIEKAGGGLIGMSGAPLVQDGKMIGSLIKCNPFNRKKCTAIHASVMNSV